MSKAGGSGRGKGSRRRNAGGAAGSSQPRGRRLAVKLRTAKGRGLSSTRWLERQLSDPYVADARRRGYRSRAAFKLAQIDDKCRILKRGARVVDLGAAPGGWSQVALQRVGASGEGGGRVVGIDLQAVDALAGATFLEGDFLDDNAAERLKAALGGPADVVLSDMAAPASGHSQTDHLRIMALAEAAYAFAAEVLAPGGAFVAKVFQGGSERSLLTALKRDFSKVQHVKPPASRPESAEVYVVASGFRGGLGGRRSEG
ncbi:MAG: RlmE family RNA methyltransferase [Kiloniellales bacterium]